MEENMRTLGITIKVVLIQKVALLQKQHEYQGRYWGMARRQ